MNERIRTIKRLISGQVDMGTFRLVELELIALEEEFTQAYSQTPVSVSVCEWCNNKLCDSQKFNNTCFNCGKSPYSKQTVH
jgi:hypothetical protein